MPNAKPASRQVQEPRSSVTVPAAIAVVLVVASLAALYAGGFLSPFNSKKEFVCWNGDVVDSAQKCAAQPVVQCPTQASCPVVPTPIVVTEREVASGKQAVAATVFRVADFKASSGMLSLVLENAGSDERFSNVNVVGITSTNDTDKATGSWENSTRLVKPGDKSPWLSFPEASIASKRAGENFSITVTIYYTNWRAEWRQEQWILKGKVE